MAEPCLPDIDKLKLVRDGTEQGERFPEPLDPQSVPVHDRPPARSMLFAREYAAFLRFYSASNQVDGDWRDFFSKDVSIALAAAAVQDVARYRSVILGCFAALEDLGNESSPEVVRRNLGFIFGAVGTLARQLDVLKDTLPGDIALKATIVNLIKTRLAGQLKRLLSWFKADQERLPADLRLLESVLIVPEPRDDYEVSILGVAPGSFEEMLEAGLSQDWFGEGTWDDFKAGIASDASVYGDPAGTVFELANACAGHALFSGACDQFLKAYARIVSDAKVGLAATLEAYDKHAPHYTLFLAFLQMFEYARADINDLGGKHLEFYYRKVLQLAERPAQPARAHVVLELTKNAEPYELSEATEFKAGKDAQKNPVVFASDQALVVNKAVVSSVGNLHRDADADAIYVNAEARVEDGSWHPFQNAVQIGSFGFSLASHYLYLAEGTRSVKLTAAVEGYTGSVRQSLADALVCRFTTADGWLEISPATCEFTNLTTLELTVDLDGNQPGITAFDAEVHASSYDVELPILEVRLKAVTGMLGTFGALETVLVRSILLAVDVTGFRSLTLSTDLGPADASKPFQPFGPAPVAGSSLVIGCQEAFSKKGLDSAELVLTWRDWSSSLVQASIFCLSGGQWADRSTKVDVLNANPATVSLTGHLIDFNATDDASLTFVAPFSLKSASGYVKLSLRDTLGHENYAASVTEWVIAAVTGEKGSRSRAPSAGSTELRFDRFGGKIRAALPDSEDRMPVEPYTPELEAITLSYAAKQSIDCGATKESPFDGRTARFYHVTPFGVAEQPGYQRVGSEETGVSLLPLLSHRDAQGTRVPHEGELYIGLAGVEAPQNVALLFQVVDGSADPLAEKPSPHLHFSYLRSGDWVAFASDEVDDRTSELLASGVITFSIPTDATIDDALLPGGLTWIRIAVGKGVQAVCRLLDVKAQAVQVTFADRDNDPELLATPLAAGTITKLVAPVAAIKSVTQPYESFDGQIQETGTAFHTRASERLRHKDRAITLWDIERLVLEAFPGIHRVKCLNHTRYKPTTSGAGTYEEFAAGHITVVTIPEVSEGYAADPLTPYASLSVLGEIKAYLEERLSCFVTLHVCNPEYERLRVACKVRLRAGFDETYSLGQLRDSLTLFLAPWAYDAVRRPTFGGKVHRSSLIDILEEQECVDYVTDFQLYKRRGDGTESAAQAVVEGTRAVSVLASVSAAEHVITAVDESVQAGAGERCGCSP